MDPQTSEAVYKLVAVRASAKPAPQAQPVPISPNFKIEATDINGHITRDKLPPRAILDPDFIGRGKIMGKAHYKLWKSDMKCEGQYIYTPSQSLL